MKAFFATFGLLALAVGWSMPARADEYSFTRTFDRAVPAAGAAQLVVSGRNGNVSLYGDGGHTVRIHAVMKARSAAGLDGISIAVKRSGENVQIESICGSTRTFLFWSFADCDIEYEIRYPRSMALQVRNDNGNVEVEAAAAVSVTNSNGNVTVNDVAGNVNVSNKNGNLKVALAGNWHGTAISLSTRAGNATLRVPPGFAAKLDAHTRMGDVRDTANLRNGPVTVTATTTFGNVNIERE